MSDARQYRPAEPLFGRASTPAWDGVSSTVFRIVVLMLAGAVAIRLIDGLKVGLIEASFLAGVLVAAAGFGLIPGVLAAASGLVGYHVLTGAAMPPPDLRSRETSLLVLFGLSIAVIGFYTDTVRQRHRPAPRDVGSPLPARASRRTAGHIPDLAKHKEPRPGRAPLALEAQRAATSLLITGAGITAAITLTDVLGTLGCLLTALAAVLLVAGLMGARFGLASGVLAGILLTLLSKATFNAALAPPLAHGFNIALFAAFGAGVGSLSDRVRHEREALQTLVDASRNLSSGADETSERQILFDSLSRLVRGGEVGVFDEHGRSIGASRSTQEPAGIAGANRGWRIKRLDADSRDVGFVRWRFPRTGQSSRLADQIAHSLIDLGASAIVRSRLNAEKAEVEYLARAEHMRTILLDAVSHHFRSPLAGILGSVTSILSLPERHDKNIRRELLLIIKDQANRLNSYVDKFLSLARLESGSLDIKMSDVNIDSLVYDVWETFGEVGGARRYLHVEVDPRPVRTDPNLLSQILANALENAIKFSPEESLIRVRSERTGDGVIIEVADQGCGAPPEKLDRIFQRFYRNTGANPPGLGLGLFIARSLVQLLGGTITARNRNDSGTGLIISVSLPTGPINE